MSLPYWGEGKALFLPVKPTGGLAYWGDGAPPDIIYNPVQVVEPAAIDSAEAFGTAVLIVQAILRPEGIESTELVSEGTQVVPGPVMLHPEAIESQEAFGTTIVAPTQFIRDFSYRYMGFDRHIVTVIGGIPGDLFRYAEVYYATSLSSVFPFILPNVGRPVVMPGTARICVPESIPSPDPFGLGNDFGTPEITCGPVDVVPVGIESQEDFGQAKLVLHLFPVGIASAEAVGNPQVNQVIHPVGILPVDAYGTAELTCGLVEISPTGIESQEGVGEPALGGHIRTIGLESEEAFGTARLTLFIKPEAIPEDCQVGTPRVVYLIKPTGIPEECQVGTPQVIKLIKPVGIASGEAFGAVEVITGPVWIYPSGIVSGESLGRVWVKSPREPADLIVLEVVSLPTLKFTDGLDEVDLYESPLRMVVNG
jgi:hypothetical protein